MNFLSSCCRQKVEHTKAANEGSHTGIGGGVESLVTLDKLVLVDNAELQSCALARLLASNSTVSGDLKLENG